MSIQDSTQKPLPFSFPNFEVLRKSPGKFHDTVIEERGSRFKAHSHCRPIDFDEYAVGQIGDHIEEHHLVERTFRSKP